MTTQSRERERGERCKSFTHRNKIESEEADCVFTPFSVFHFFFFFRVSVSSTPAAEQKSRRNGKTQDARTNGSDDDDAINREIL